MPGANKHSLHRKPLSARHSRLMAPSLHPLTAIVESGIGRNPNATVETLSSSESRNSTPPLRCNPGADYYQDQWDICCASACEFDRLKSHFDPAKDLDTLDHLFLRIYTLNDFPILEEGVFNCDSEADESLDSVSEGDTSRDTDGHQTPISYKKCSSPLYPWASPSKVGIASTYSSYPVTLLSNSFSPSSSVSSPPMAKVYSPSKGKISSSVNITYVGSGISGLVDQLGPVLNSE